MLDERKQCFICGRKGQLDVHHCISGTANRKMADIYGLTVYLCRDCHGALHDKGKYDMELKQFAQRQFEAKIGSRDDFRRIFGKSWL